ncbi:MAG: fibronectin type III-like domain-contianing protein, partial [Alistipes sp.]|nr:fibronectin type III-like domain-contianing protein [Alistipes sp.]
TTFEYGNVSLNRTTFGTADTIVVEFALTNTGSRPGVEVAQLYTRDMVGSVVRPVKELKRFRRVALQPGETQHLRFELPVAELAFWNRDMKYVVEPGDFQLWVASDSASGLGHPFTVE